MASPQLENGYLQIAREIAEALCKVNLSAYESRVLWFIFLKTYGFKKKMDWIALSQFAKCLGIDRRLIHRALKGLSSKKMTVIGRDDKNRPTYGFQKDYSQWKVSSKKMTVISTDDSLSSKEIHTKETLTKQRESARKNTSRPKDTDPRVKQFIDFYHDEYQTRFGDKYCVTRKDAAQVKRLLQTYHLGRLKELALQFLNSSDPWVRQNGGFTIGILASQINKLVSTTRANSNSTREKELPV